MKKTIFIVYKGRDSVFVTTPELEKEFKKTVQEQGYDLEADLERMAISSRNCCIEFRAQTTVNAS